MTPLDVIGGYTLVNELASGSHAVIWKVEKDGTFFAAKFAKVDREGKNLLRLQKEAKILGELRHEHVIPVLDVLQDGDIFGLVFPLYESSLSKVDLSLFSLESKVEIARQILAGIGYVHRQGIIQGDIKPANVLVSVVDGIILVAVCDFGISWYLSDGMPDESEFHCSPAFCGPEVFLNEEITFKTDIYAVGVTLYWLFSNGRMPFPGPTTSQYAAQHVYEQPTSIIEVPLQIERVILQALLHKVTSQRREAHGVRALLDAAYNDSLQDDALGIMEELQPERERKHVLTSVFVVVFMIVVVFPLMAVFLGLYKP